MRTLAATLVHDCMRVRPSDNASISFYPHTTRLAEEIATECFRAGADAILVMMSDAFYRSYLDLLPEESLRQPSEFCRALADRSTAQFWIRGPYDPAFLRKIPSEKAAIANEADAKAHSVPRGEGKRRALWIALGLVTRPRAKAYGFPFSPWERTVREASGVPAAKLRTEGRRLAALLEAGDRVRIRDKGGTDLEFSIRGRSAYVYDGVIDDEDLAAGATDASIPGGNVNVSPIETSAEGTFVSNVPQPRAGRMIRRMRWEFRGGRVASFGGDANALRFRREWDASGGDRDRIGTFSIGLNPRATFGFISNEIVRGGVSIGIGQNQDEGGSNRPGFYHMQTLADATVELDGKTIVRKGKLVAL